MPKVPAIDLILFWGIVGTIGAAHSLLLTSGTPWETTSWFYIVTWISAMVILLWCRVLYGETQQISYDQPLSQNKLLYVGGGLVAVLFASSILVRSYTRSSIWVPQPHMTLALGTLSLSSVVNDMFYQIALVSNSEETMCLSLSQVLRRRLSQYKYGAIAAIAIPRVGWSLLHAYISYTGPLMPILVLSAFVSGCIISYCAYNKNAKCFLIALLIHALFNIAIVLISALGG
jgi:hypothetical protein